MDSPSKNTLEPGMVLNDRWIVMDLIGKGGMGEVYRVHQLNLKRDIALKIISQNFLAEIQDDEYEAETSLERFKREVQVMAQIRHANILQIYDCGAISFNKDGKTLAADFIATEYIPGDTLRSTMSDDGFSSQDNRMKEWISAYFLPILEGTKALNEQGIVHRDLKPENILLDGKTPKIADFGLARSNQLKSMTQSMDVKGTPPYMSPEHFMDLKRTDQRTDIYALGKILYEAAAGRITSKQIPFQKASLKEPDTPFFQKLDSIIQTATEVDKELRYSSADSFRRALEEAMAQNGKASAYDKTYDKDPVQQKIPRRGRRMVMWTVALVIMGLAASAAFLFFTQKKLPLTPKFMSIHYGHGKKTADKTGVPEPQIQGSDHALLLLVDGGSYQIPDTVWADAGKTVEIPSFYMDETLVTNYQYVEFLNQVLSRIRVENDVVYSGKDIWLSLGEVAKGFEPIVFQNGRFQIHGTQHSACPVLRVTALGSSAYAAFFERRLPVAEEWSYVADTGKADAGKQTAPKESGHGPHGVGMGTFSMSFPEPVMLSTPDRYGIRGLNEKTEEWVSVGHDYAVIGRTQSGEAKQAGNFSAIRRSPWESFSNVGFRTVISRASINQ